VAVLCQVAGLGRAARICRSASARPPLGSGALASYGEEGPGKWITIYANATHTYMEVAGLRFDTAGNLPGVSGPRWKTYPADYGGEFVVRHPTGY